MKIVIAEPPLFEEIDRRFRVRGNGIVFAFGSIIYNPDGVEVRPEIVAHENEHGLRQGADALGWWRRYIDDPEFRLAEEIPAHAAEFKFFCRIHTDRNHRARYLQRIASRLAGPLYGNLMTAAAAAAAIRG